MRGRALVELFNEIASSPLSDSEAPVAYNHFSQQLNQKVFGQCSQRADDSGAELDTESSFSEIDLLSDEDESECDVLSQQDEICDVDTKFLLPSQPVRNNFSTVDTICVPYAINSPACSSALSFEVSPKPFPQMLYDGADISVETARALIDLLCCRYNFSDESSKAVHSLTKFLLPADHSFSSAYSLVKKMKKSFQEQVRFLSGSKSNSLCVLNFRYQLRDIIGRHLNKIFDYSTKRKKNPHVDFNHSICPVVENNEHSIRVSLLLFTDGVNLKKLTIKKEVWPIWVQVADLPPRLRMSRNNTALAGLFGW